MGDAVHHPDHYGGKDNPYETVKVCEAWGFDKDTYLFQVIKYVSRADKKGAELQDLEKAKWYLERKIGIVKRLEEAAQGRGGEKDCDHNPIEKVGEKWRCSKCGEGFMSYNDAQTLMMRGGG